MNKKKAMLQLVETLKGIYVYPAVYEEIHKLIAGSGNEIAFFRLLNNNLKYVREFKREVTKLKQFELLSNNAGIYSMRLNSAQFNIRILFSFSKDDELLLCCFYERGGKLKTDYSTHIPIAQQREQEMLQRRLLYE